MKNISLFTIFLVLIILAAIGGGYLAGYQVYKEYKEKTAYLEQQAQMKFGELEKDLRDLHVTLENTMDVSKIERNELFSKLEEIKKDIKDWERSYKAALLELRGKIEGLKVERLTRNVEILQQEINAFKMKMQDMELKIEQSKSIDLGKISVGK